MPEKARGSQPSKSLINPNRRRKIATVRLRHNWFAPSEAWDKMKHHGVKADGTSYTNPVSGTMYRRGVVEVPDDLLKMLPSTAEILSGPVQEPEEEDVPQSLEMFDESRVGHQAEDIALNKKSIRMKQKK